LARKAEIIMVTPHQATLLDLVQTVNAYAATDDEIVATIAYLVNSGHIRLCGNFAGAKIVLPARPRPLPNRRGVMSRRPARPP
jgi:hypothetical protein